MTFSFYQNSFAFLIKEEESSVTISVTLLDVVLMIVTMLYCFCFFQAKRKLSSLDDNSHDAIGLKKLLVLSILLVCVIRIMTFFGVTCMDIANVRAHYSPSPSGSSGSEEDFGDNRRSNEKYQNFYNASMAVLFDLPNTMVVSTYVLLTLVWAECFTQSRLHTEDEVKLKLVGVYWYTTFNTCLYFVQLILYVLVFLVRFVRNILYVAMTGINLAAVSMVGILYFYLNVKFAGYPSRSIRAQKSLNKISKVLAMWTVSRILWAIAFLVVFVYQIELLHSSKYPVLSPILLISLFVLCEITPIIVMLDYSYMQMIGFERDDGRNQCVDALVEQDFNGDTDEWFGCLDNPLTTSRLSAENGREEPFLLQV